MPKNYQTMVTDISTYAGELKNVQPDVMKNFHSMAQAAIQDGALDKKTKELIALAIGVAKQCDGCIGFHTRTLHQLGATRQEVAEMLGVSIYMGGGPALMYAADALRAFDQFSSGEAA